MLSRYIMAAACLTNSLEAVLGRYMGLKATPCVRGWACICLRSQARGTHGTHGCTSFQGMVTEELMPSGQPALARLPNRCIMAVACFKALRELLKA